MDFDFKSAKDHNSLFFTLGKGEGDNSQLTYKSECQKYHDKNYQFRRILISTDALATLDEEEKSEVIITIYKYGANGSHKKLLA